MSQSWHVNCETDCFVFVWWTLLTTESFCPPSDPTQPLSLAGECKHLPALCSVMAFFETSLKTAVFIVYWRKSFPAERSSWRQQTPCEYRVMFMPELQKLLQWQELRRIWADKSCDTHSYSTLLIIIIKKMFQPFKAFIRSEAWFINEVRALRVSSPSFSSYAFRFYCW